MSLQGQTDRVTTFKIFVKNLPIGMSEEELKAIFEEFGRVVECKVFRDTFAFIHMEEEANGVNAITMLNERSIRGSIISVEESTQKDQGPSVPSTRLRVKNIPSSLNAMGLRSLFTKYGLILAAEITNGEGIVSIEATGDLRTAMTEVNGFVYDGASLSVEPLVNTSAHYTPKTMPPMPRPLPLLPNPRFRGRTGQNFQNYPVEDYSSSNYYNNGSGGLPFKKDYNFIRGPRPGNPRYLGNGNASWNNTTAGSEGRVLREPYGPGLRPLMSVRSPMPHSNIRSPMQNPYSSRPLFSGPRQARLPYRPLLMSDTRQHSNTNIEPLFLKRNEILKSDSSNSNNNKVQHPFYEDEPLEHFGQPKPDGIPDFGTYSSSLNNNNTSLPPPLMSQRPPPLMFQGPPPLMSQRPSYGTSLSVKRRVPDVAPGEAFEVPSMIPPGTFQPPKKYFANHQRPANKKKKKREPTIQPPIPEERRRPIPDFSPYYSQLVPPGTVLKPFPPPLMNQNADFSEDI